VGIKLLKAVRSRLKDHDPQSQLALAWLAIDTERETLKATYGEEEHANLSADDKLHIPLRRPNQYRDDSQALLQWVSRRWLYNIPRSLLTRGFRPLGRIAVVDHAVEVLTALQRRLQWLIANHQSADATRPAARVVILAGMSGGTGGGTAVDIAQAVRALCRDLSGEVTVQAVLGCTYHPESNDSLAAANMYSLLTELAHAQCNGNCGDSPPPSPASLYESPDRPFDAIYTVPLLGREGRSDCDLALHSVADYLLLNASGKISPAINAIHATLTEDSEVRNLRTFGCSNLGQLKAHYAVNHQQTLLKTLIADWLKEEPSIDDPDARFFQSHRNSRFARAVLTRFPEVPTALSASTCEAEMGERGMRRSAKIKCIAQGFLQFLDGLQLELGDDQAQSGEPAAVAIGEGIFADVCQLVDNGKHSESELAQQILESVERQLAALVEIFSGGEGTELAEAALRLLAAGPLDCGYQRHTILVEPPAQSETALLQAFRQRCPTLASFSTPVIDSYLIREGSGLSPLHLGARLAELYPDIADAAGRLHSRDDIKWQDLRATRAEFEVAASR
jgi:hypothetical protein